MVEGKCRTKGFDLHIDRGEGTVSDGTADGTSESESGVELETAEFGGGPRGRRFGRGSHYE